MKSEHRDLFDAVLPLIHKVFVLTWGTCAKHLTQPVFISQHLKGLALLFDKADLDKLVRAGDDWLVTEADTVLKLSGEGELGEALFSGKIKNIVEDKLHTVLTSELEKLCTKNAADKEVLSDDSLHAWRRDLMSEAEAQVMRLTVLPSRRKIKVCYRGQFVHDISISSLSDQVELMIMARYKGSAIAHEFLKPLEAEKILGFQTIAADTALTVQKKFFEKAVFNLFL